MTATIRPSVPSDGPSLREIERLAGERFREVGLDHVADDEPFSVEELAMYAAGGRGWVALSSTDVPVGYVIVDEIDGNVHIEQVSVRPDNQGQGIGRALVEQVCRWAVSRGVPAVTLTTFSEVAWNRPLYEHLGFIVMAADEIGPELDHVRHFEAAHGLDPRDRVCMRLPLSVVPEVTPPAGAGTGLAVAMAIEQSFAEDLRELADAMRQVAPESGATATRCGDGIAAFLGDGSPLTTVKGMGCSFGHREIDDVEAFFRSHGAGRATFELTPWVSTATKERLVARQYSVVDSEDVVAARPSTANFEPGDEVSLVSADDWPDLQIEVDEEAASIEWRPLVEACAIVPGAMGFAIHDGAGAPIACAQLTPVRDVGIFGNDATTPLARRKGAQTALIRARGRAAAGAALNTMVAEVAPGSTSERNYLRCGFKVAYTRQHYARALK